MEQQSFSFLKNSGEMSVLITRYNWSATSLGPIEGWSPCLRAHVAMMLASRFPMLIFWSKDLITFYNDAFRPSLGDNGKHPSSLGQKGEESWAESWPVIGPMIYNIMAGGDAVWFEDQKLPIYREGKMDYAYWTYSFSPILDDEELVAGILVTCAETTKAVENLNQLELLQQQQEMAIEAAELGTWDYDPATDTFIANQRLKEWFGFDLKDEIELSAGMNGLHDKDRDRVAVTLKQAMQAGSGGRYEEEFTIVHPLSGKQTIVQAKGQAHFNEEGEAIRLNGTLRDVTQQVVSRKRIEETEQKLLAAIDMAELATWSIDAITKRITYSERLQQWLGIEASHLTPEGSTNIVEADRERISKAIAKAMDPEGSGELDEMYTVVNSISGQKRIIHVNGRTVFDLNKNPLVLSGTAQDITIQQQMQLTLEHEVQTRTMELESTVEELTATNEEMAEVNRQLTHSNEELAQYAYVASHDLQEPLRKIKYYSSQLSAGQQTPDGVQRTVGRIQQSTERMSLLIHDLLEYSQLLKSDTLVRPVSLKEVIEEIINDFELVITEKQAEINIHSLPVIEAVRLQMNQLFYNLIGNALKFSKPGQASIIDIRSSIIAGEELTAQIDKIIPETDYYLIEVRDNGIGFEPKYVDQIFELFKRLHGRAEYGGSGIGLALCRRIVYNHQGNLLARSEPGNGACFSIVLPARQTAYQPSVPSHIYWKA